jgi:myo-inositol 2-dehydrogenase / D-chiro-inositol 1-dehydrogenase
MKNDLPHKPANLTRRDFLMASTAATAVGALTTSIGPVFAAGSDKIRVGLVGCGSRGTGVAMNCVLSSPGVEIVALGDVFPDQVEKALARLKDNSQPREWSCSAAWKNADAVKVTKETCFSGFDAYQKVIASGVDVVLLATPPHFRPTHLRAAIAAGKHVFMEKPVAVDPVGIRSIIATAELAKQKGLAIVAGTQRRHDPGYIEVMKRLHQGAIGEIVAGECYWNGPCVRTYGFFHPRQKEWTEAEWQLRNWYFYTWLSGDHIVEQHVHNLDVINWAMGSPPVEALGMGGRQWRVQPEFGNIYDHFSVRYKYPNGATVLSMARQINNCADLVFESLIGTKGRAQAGLIEGLNPFKYQGSQTNPYEQEHADLIKSIRDGQPLNEGRQVAESTLTAIIGRMSAYTGRVIKFDWALNKSELDLTPKDYKVDRFPVPPVSIPGEEDPV